MLGYFESLVCGLSSNERLLLDLYHLFDLLDSIFHDLDIRSAELFSCYSYMIS